MLIKCIICSVIIFGANKYVNGYHREVIKETDVLCDEPDYPEDEKGPSPGELPNLTKVIKETDALRDEPDYPEYEMITKPKESPSVTKCKEYHPILKIINGNVSVPKEFPHMALLGYEGEDGIEWKCGGSLISYDFVLTAAHCIMDRQLGEVKFVRLGEHDINSTTDDADPQNFTIKKTYIHTDYHPPSHYNDIALIQLDREVNVTDYVSPACLAFTEDLDNINVTLIGFGYTSKYGNSSNVLQKASLQVLPTENCSVTYEVGVFLRNGFEEKFQICAFGVANKSDACFGDSGGAVQITNDFYDTSDFYEIIGVTSFGKSCGEVPTAYTRVLHYVPWIEGIVWPS